MRSSRTTPVTTRGRWILIQRANKLVPAPTISIWHARILAKLGRLIEANERYEATRRATLPEDAPEAFRVAVREAGDEVERLRTRIPRIRLRIVGKGSDSPSLAVKLDGKPVPKELIGVLRTVDPGVHLVEAKLPGVSSATQRVEVAEGEGRDVDLSLAPVDTGAGAGAESAGPGSAGGGGSSRKTWGFVAAGAGVTGLALGVGFGLAAQRKSAALEQACDGSSCPASERDNLDAYRTQRTIAWIGYGVGAAGLATAAALFWLVGDESKPSSVSAYVGVGAVGLGGTF